MAESLRRAVRIANCSGLYGDRIAAAREMLAGPIDVLTGDYLAELTMLRRAGDLVRHQGEMIEQ